MKHQMMLQPISFHKMILKVRLSEICFINFLFKTLKILFAFLMVVLFYISALSGCIFIFFRDKNKLYYRTMKSYRQFKSEQLQRAI